MTSQPNVIVELEELCDEVQRLRRQNRELEKTGKVDEAWEQGRLLSKLLDETREGLRHQIDDLIKAGKYAEAVPSALRFAATHSSESLEFAEALIDLAELLIAVERSAEAELVLQRAFAIIVETVEAKQRFPHIYTALSERVADIDSGRLIQSVSALRELIAYRKELWDREPVERMSAREPFSYPAKLSPEEEERQRVRWEAAAREAAVREEERKRSYEALRIASETAAARAPDPNPSSPSLPSPVASAPAPHPADTKRERVVLAHKLARRSTKPEPEATPVELASFSASRQHKPDASTPEGALAIEAGRLAYQIPNRMWVGVQETVEVRLGAVIAKEIMEGFVGRGDIKLEHVPIVETMSVSLVCQPGTFDIAPQSKETQLVKPDLVKGTAFYQQDFARWIWVVTPRQRGKHTLFVKVSAAIKDSRGLPTTSSLPDKIIAVTVRVDLVRAATGAFWRIAPGLAWAVATTLVGIFTKDYWWPYLRDTILPAVGALAGTQ
jgi:tetratricopeptide (TPR) repeat protein